MVGVATPKAFIEDMASSGFSENKRLGGVLSPAGSKLHSSLEERCVIFYNYSAWRVIFVLDFRIGKYVCVIKWYTREIKE